MGTEKASDLAVNNSRIDPTEEHIRLEYLPE